MTTRFFIILLCLCLCTATIPSNAQLLNNRIAVANSMAFGSALQPVLINRGTSTELLLKANSKQEGLKTFRGTWDFSFNTNLVHCAGVRLRILVRNPQLGAPFDIYLKFASTWYAAHFTPSKEDTWEDIYIPKTKFKPEGNPESWAQCSMIRIAANLKSRGDLTIHLAELECVRPNALFAIIRSGTQADKIKASYRYAEILGDALASYGLRPAVIEDADCQTIYLKPYTFAFVPLIEAASPEQETAVSNLIRRGSKVGLFHSLPKRIMPLLQVPDARIMSAQDLPVPLGGVEPDTNKLPGTRTFRQPSTSFIGVTTDPQHLNVTAWWQDANGKKTNWPAIIQTNQGFWMTHVFQNNDPQNAVPLLIEQTSQFLPGIKRIGAQTCLNDALFAFHNTPNAPSQAAQFIDTARRLQQAGHDVPSIIFSQKCLNLLKAPPSVQVAPPPNEFRAVWCRSLSGLPGRSWESTISMLNQCRFNAVFPMTATPYSANFSTSLLPKQPFQPAFEDCLAAARKHGVQVHAWINCLHAVEAPDTYKKAMKDAGRLQINTKITPQTPSQKNTDDATVDWLCPSNPQNRLQVVTLVRTVAQSFPVDGIHLDLIRYASSQTCFCPTCRGYFEKYIGRKLAYWPADVLNDGSLRNEWIAFRQMVITSLVIECAQNAKAIRPSVKVSAAVFPDLDIACKTVAQNWKDWIRSDGLDFICPMNYKSTTLVFQADIDRQIKQLGSPGRILPGIGVSSERLLLDEVRRQINATRTRKMPGFILFQLGPREAADILPNLDK